MKLLKLSLTAIAIAGLTFNINAQQVKQGNWCKTDEILQEQFDKDPQLEVQFYQALEDRKSFIENFVHKSTNNKKPAPTYIIPVVVHNITHSGGVGYVSKANIDAAIDSCLLYTSPSPRDH